MTSPEHAMREAEDERHPGRTEWFWSELRLLHERWDVFSHPLYERWSTTGLTDAALRHYAQEHDHLVRALSTIAERASGKAGGLLGDVLAEHVTVVADHGAQWRELARETAWNRSASDASPAAAACVEVWLGDADRRLALDLVTLLSAEPAPDGRVRAGLAGLLQREDPLSLLAHARAVHSTYWSVLDTLERNSTVVFSDGRGTA